MITRREFEELYKNYHETILVYCWGKTGNQEDAEDLTQEVFTKALEKVVDYEDEGKAYAWLCKIADWIVLDKVRKKMRRKKGGFQEVSLDGLVDLMNRKEGHENELPIADEGQDLDKHIEKKEIWGFVNELPYVEKRIVYMLTEGKTQEDIGKELELPRTTIEYQIKKIMSKLVKKMEGNLK